MSPGSAEEEKVPHLRAKSDFSEDAKFSKCQEDPGVCQIQHAAMVNMTLAAVLTAFHFKPSSGRLSVSLYTSVLLCHNCSEQAFVFNELACADYILFVQQSTFKSSTFFSPVALP